MGLPDRPSKHDAFLALLREGRTSLHFDARRAGVVVPARLQGEGHLVLEYGYDLRIPIPDLQIDPFGVTATLSFWRTPHHTAVPWSAVYVVASADGRGVLYHEDVPPDVSVIARPDVDPAIEGAPVWPVAPPDEPVAPDISPRPSPTRALRAVPLGGVFEDPGDELLTDSGASSVPVRKRRRPQLRLIK